MACALGKSESHKFYEKLAGPTLLALAVAYLVFHALSGELGIYALLKEDRKLTLLKAELTTVEGQRKDLEHRVRLLSAGSLDLDLLDEQSRSILGVAAPNEIVIPQQGGK